MAAFEIRGEKGQERIGWPPEQRFGAQSENAATLC